MKSSADVTWELTRAASPRVTILGEVESTNDWLLSRETVSPFEIVVSFCQKQGRGRLGRSWIVQPGQGLALSLVVPGFSNNLGRPFGSGVSPSLTVGVSLLRALNALGLKNAELKWPNDILVGRDKLAGILCEFHQDGSLVAGVGMNVGLTDYPPELKATALAKFLTEPFARIDELVASFIREVDVSFRSPEKARWEAAVQALSTLGAEVKVLPLKGKQLRGRAAALGTHGELIVDLSDGSQVTVSSSDIEHLYQ